MNRELTITDEALSPEVKWLNQMFGTSPETAVIQVTTLLGAVMLRRTDHTQWRQTVIPAQGIEQKSICVEANNLDRALKTLTGTIRVSFDDERLVLADSERTVKLRAATNFDYPDWPAFQSDEDRTPIGAVQFGRVLTSVGHDEALPQLSVVAFDRGSMVTTDRFRMTTVNYGKSKVVAQVPSEVMKAFAKSGGVVWSEFGKVDTPGFQSGGDDLWVRMTSGGRSVTAATADTTFPKWRQLIPAEAPVILSLQRDDLLKAVGGVEMTLTLSKPDANGKGSVSVTSSTDGMDVEQVIELVGAVRYDGESPLTVTLQTRYVKEALKAIASGLVLLTATASDKPVMFQDIAKNDLHMIMPVRQPQVS